MELFREDQPLTTVDICRIHNLWLGDIYPSAGKYRSVNMEKDGFPFAVAGRIEKLMQEFENNFLKKYIPCNFTANQELADAIGIVHVEFIIIHPFREGNGRTARMLADLMAMQAKREPIDYSIINQTANEGGFKNYIEAIHAGFNGDYEPIEKIFLRLVSQSE